MGNGTDYLRAVSLGLMWFAFVLNMGSYILRWARKKKVNCDMEEAIDKYIHDPCPETVFAVWLQERYPDGNCELVQTLREYRQWKEEKKPGTPLRLLNDGFIVSAIMRGLDKKDEERPT